METGQPNIQGCDPRKSKSSVDSPSLVMSPAREGRIGFHFSGGLTRGEDKITDLDFPDSFVRKREKIQSGLPGDFIREEETMKMLDAPAIASTGRRR